jgi:hypothetical protein
MTKKYIRISTLTLAALLLLFIATIHIPQLFDADKHLVAMISLLKDVSLLGGSLMIAGMTKEKA